MVLVIDNWTVNRLIVVASVRAPIRAVTLVVVKEWIGDGEVIIWLYRSVVDLWCVLRVLLLRLVVMGIDRRVVAV